MHSLRLAQAPHAADLDVDDPAGAQVEGLARVVGRVNALVEADRRLQGRLEPGVVDDVVVRQGLFDQEEVEVVERLERGQVIERIRRVGVDLQGDRGKSLAHPPHDRRHPIPARFSA